MERVRDWILSNVKEAEAVLKRKREGQNQVGEPTNKKAKEDVSDDESVADEKFKIRKSLNWRDEKSKIYLFHREFEETFNSSYWFKWRPIKQEDDF